MSAKKRGAATIAFYIIGGAIAGAARVPYFAIPVPLVAGFMFIWLARPQPKEKAAIAAAIFVGAIAGLMVVALLMLVKAFGDGEDVRFVTSGGGEFQAVFVSTVIANVAIGAVLGGLGGLIAERARGGQAPIDPPEIERPGFDESSDLRDRWWQ